MLGFFMPSFLMPGEALINRLPDCSRFATGSDASSIEMTCVKEWQLIRDF